VDEEDVDEYELFDISDITIDLIPRKTRKEAILQIKGKRELGVMRYYLALKAHLHTIEIELGVMDESDQR
jgi:hypothetical protein